MKKKEAEKKRFVVYTRCSTDDQAQGDFTTLDAQAYHCKNMLDAFGYELAKFGKKGFIYDDGYSGKDLKRPGMQSILNNIGKQKPFDGIIFFRLDRLTRNPRDLYALIDLFRDNDIDFISVRENLDSSTAIGRVVIGILGILAAFERELTGERVKASIIARARQGKWLGGTVPFGYKLIKDGEPLSDGRQPHKLVIDKKIGPKIKFIWEMASENKSLGEIGHELIKRKILSPKENTWRKQSVSRIIKNPIYKGYIKHKKEVYKAQTPGFVDEAIWDKANKMLSAKLPGHRFIKRPGSYNYLLTGILKCGGCGSYCIATNAKGHSGGKFFYYICTRKKQGLGCDASRISATAFDNAIIDYFKKASEDQKIIIKAIGDAILDSKEKLSKIDKDLKKAESRLKALKTESDRLLELAMKNTLSKGVSYKEKMEKLDEEIAQIEDKIAKLQAKKRVAQMSADSGQFLHSNISFAMKHIGQAPPEAQKSLLRALIKEILVYEDHIEIKMYIGQPIEKTLSSHLSKPSTENNGNGHSTTMSLSNDCSGNGKDPTEASGALNAKAEGLPERQCWLPERAPQTNFSPGDLL